MWRTPANESRYSFYRIGWVNPESERTTEIKFPPWVGFEPTTSWSTVQRVTIELSPLLYIKLNIKPLSRTRSSGHLCISLPPVSTRFKFADRSFRNSSPRLWNSLPINLRFFAPDTHRSTTVISSTPSHPCRALSLSRNQFLSCIKTHLFTLSYPP